MATSASADNDSVRVESLSVRNFTVFRNAEFKFSRDLNVIVGENGAGKTHVLKAVYSIVQVLSALPSNLGPAARTKGQLQSLIAAKLTNVFRAESLGRLAKRQRGRQRCEIRLTTTKPGIGASFGFATSSRTEVRLSRMPIGGIPAPPAYIPTRELLTVYPNFVSLYDRSALEFDETWRDTCLLLGLPVARGPRLEGIDDLLGPIEEAMDGRIEYDRSGRFYLRSALGRIEMPLVAEGKRKLGMIARLVLTGALLDDGFLFWDEPESNLHPVLIRTVARTILQLCARGIQVFVATHSLFLLREFDLLCATAEFADLAPRYLGLSAQADGIALDQADAIGDLDGLSALDEEIGQSERFVEAEG